MARVKMLKTAAGPLGSFMAGAQYEVADDTALAWAEAGACTLLHDLVEVATRPPVENAARRVVPPTRKRRGG